MPYSIAAPIVTSRTLMVRIGADGFHRRAHNDNGSALPEPDAQSDMLLAAALKCLTQHGLRAAQEALYTLWDGLDPILGERPA